MDGGDHEWELSKENVQPLRQGRHISSLVAALHSDQSEEHNIKIQQNNFELELRTYSGDDPFSVWDSYIKWTEQNYPKGGHDGQLMKLLERCLREFQGDERYTNDSRFIHMWIKFACSTEDPTVVFSYMFDNGIGVNIASFYVEWALILERLGDTKRADAIYTEGLNRQAEPKQLLLQKHQLFQSRVARNITHQIAEGENPGMDMGESTEKRSPLGRLKASGPAHKVGVVRTGQVKLGSAGSLKDATRPAAQKSRGITVFHDDENVVPSLAPQQNNEWQTLPVRAVDNRENDKKPGVWTDAKIKQRPGTVPSVPTAIPFQIHEDPESATNETPRKTTLINVQPLSSRKASQTDILCNLRRPAAGTSIIHEIPMYAKDKIYNGLSEFSFEELRAAKYWKLKKEKEIEAERQRKEEEQKLKEERMQRQLLEVTEKLALLQAQINSYNCNRSADHQSQLQTNFIQQQELAHQLQESVALMSEDTQGISNSHSSQQSVASQGATKSSTQGDVENSNSNSSSNSFITPTNVIAALNASQARPSDPQSTSSSGSLRTPIFNSASTYSADSLSFARRSQLRPFKINASGSNPSFESSTLSSDGKSSITPATNRSHMGTSVAAPVNTSNVMSVGKNQSSAECLNTTGAYSHSKLSRAATPRSNKPTPENHTLYGIKGPLTAPSPTVYTKEALQCVMGMFSTSFSCDDQAMTGEVETLRGTVAGSDVPVAFEIHEDAAGTFKTERQSLKDASVKKGFQTLYCESDDGKENVLKATSVKRSVRRGLGFAIYDDVEMTDVDKEFQPMNSDFTIECQARNDTTLAPLESFSIHAKSASTPCVSALDINRSKSQLCDTVSTSLTSSTNLCVGVDTPSKNLSPILEGSGEGSREESKSCQKTHVARMEFPPTTLAIIESGHRNPIPELMEAETEFDKDVSMHEDMRSDQDRSHHQIDTSAYITPTEKVEAVLSTSVCLDPFDDKTIAHFLNNLNPPITEYPNFITCPDQMPDIANENYILLDNLYISVEKCIGEGGYAKIYKISEDYIDGEDTMNISHIAAPEKVIKAQSPPCYWEFYVSHELRRRLDKLKAPMNIVPSIMEVQRGYFYDDGSVLQMTYVPNGSLLNLVNTYKNNKSLLAGVEPFACLLTIELLHIFEQIHKCNFIHGDVKPDNFLLLALPHIEERLKNPQEVFGSQLRLVQLIDFGQSIDLTKFPQGTTFMAKVITSGFQCIEMRTDRPWTFQTDLFGLVGTIHVVLFGSYMNVFQERGVWRITANFVRKWNVPLWKQLFKELLNVPSCEQQPDLASLRMEFERYFMDSLIPAYNQWVQEFRHLEITSK